MGGLLRVGGNVNNIPVGNASVATSNGNLHIDAAKGHALYLNYFNGDSIWIGNGTGNGVALATIDSENGISCETFTGNLHGTADTAKMLTPLSGDAKYKLAYTADGQRTNAGEWGRVVMRYDPNGQTYGVRCDRADYADSAGSVAGWSVDSFKRNLCGRSTPTFTPLIDWNQNTKTANSSSYGCVGTSGQDIHLTQSWKNFDKILIRSWHGGAWLMHSTIWEKWELEQMFNGTGMIDITNGVSIDYYIYASNQGTSAHPLSTETTWYRYDSNCYIQEIYGVNY